MLILDDEKTWPKHIVEQLKTNKIMSLLKAHNSLERSITHDFDLRSIFVDVQEYAESEGLVGYHCTKQLPEKPFSNIGLRILDIETHHKEVLDLILNKKLVDKNLYKHIENALFQWRIGEKRRENKICFYWTRAPIIDWHGVKCFFKYYGGEAIFMPFIYKSDMTDVAMLLEQIGEPVVVEARLNVSNCQIFGGQYALGKTLVNYFAKSINPDFIFQDIECYSRKDVLPSDIIAVYPHKEFVELVR